MEAQQVAPARPGARYRSPREAACTTTRTHHLTHAAEGLMMHLMYEGVVPSFTYGGTAGNLPE